jgi:muramidase (phage lysozyme)
MATRKQLEQALQNPNVRKFLDLISYTEGTQGNGYRTAFGGGQLRSLNDHPRYLKTFKQTDGTLNKTSAAGRYQFLKGTWDNVARQYGLKDFSPHSQDLGAVALLFGRDAIPALLKGDFQTAVRKTGAEWASLPTSNYKQNKRSWDNVNKFLGGDYQPSQQQPQADPRLSMSAPDLLATLRKGKGKRSDNEIFMELANNNGLAGREVNYLISKGASLSDIAKDLGLNVSIAQQEPEYELPDIGGSYDDFMANIGNQDAPESQLPDIGDGYDDFMSRLQTDEPQQEQQLPDIGENYDDFMANLTLEEPQPTQAGDTWQTQNSASETTLQPKNERVQQPLKSSWESLS